ncbi:hypothetical protein GH140_01595 [bacterium]|nr:hypothetical protein [bacterium]
MTSYFSSFFSSHPYRHAISRLASLHLSQLVLSYHLGKIVPFFLLIVPRFRSLTTVTVASILVVIGIFFMRYVVVVAGEFLPLL